MQEGPDLLRGYAFRDGFVGDEVIGCAGGVVHGEDDGGLLRHACGEGVGDGVVSGLHKLLDGNTIFGNEFYTSTCNVRAGVLCLLLMAPYEGQLHHGLNALPVGR